MYIPGDFFKTQIDEMVYIAKNVHEFIWCNR